VQVVELAENLAGPWCGQILADLGADVTKVERPGGDPSRGWGPPFIDGVGSIFATTNRGKRSLLLDLRAEPDRMTLDQLIDSADVFIEAYRPGATERLGYGWETVHRRNPRLIYCSVLAYGESGPLRELPGYDPLMQAHGGIMSVTGHDSSGPARVGMSVIDMGTGMWLAIGVLAALRRRDISGAGSRVSTALYDTALAWNAYHLLGFAETGTTPGPMGSELPMIAPYGAFPTADGQIMIAAANDGLFQRLCACMDLHEAATDPRLASNALRVEHRQLANALVAAATTSHETASLLGRLRDAGVPCAPIQDMAEVAADPQTVASGMLVREEDGGKMALPLRQDGARYPPRGRVPAPGGDGREGPGR
jgi:crotonobetainyl-CoA:carnitine CoA-transferase CaiB-like acyl-CoA transferase